MTLIRYALIVRFIEKTVLLAAVLVFTVSCAEEPQQQTLQLSSPPQIAEAPQDAAPVPAYATSHYMQPYHAPTPGMYMGR